MEEYSFSTEDQVTQSTSSIGLRSSSQACLHCSLSLDCWHLPVSHLTVAILLWLSELPAGPCHSATQWNLGRWILFNAPAATLTSLGLAGAINSLRVAKGLEATASFLLCCLELSLLSFVAFKKWNLLELLTTLIKFKRHSSDPNSPTLNYYSHILNKKGIKLWISLWYI